MLRQVMRREELTQKLIDLYLGQKDSIGMHGLFKFAAHNW